MSEQPTAPVERIHIWLSDDIEVKRRQNSTRFMAMYHAYTSEHTTHCLGLQVQSPSCPTNLGGAPSAVSRALEEFRVVDRLFLDTRRPKMQPVEHPRLKALSLSGIDILPALDPYTFPALGKIYISYCKGAAKFRYMIAFIQRCKPHITHYTFAQRRDMILGKVDHNVLHLDLCRKYFNGILEHFALRDTLTKEVVNMLMQRLPDGTHRYIPIVKTLDVAMDGLGGGIVSD
ncbi:hypothetical protein D9613_012027 [Agrocybe pediades]|uniref:Uncharacterized protein n=1 Tax=Agrocybe pediades TaxID=84607 RepID=A0A8H4QEU9_9AGAR|nr:hypothetical protein D9613_012027 [Agrocybe pediades]